MAVPPSLSSLVLRAASPGRSTSVGSAEARSLLRAWEQPDPGVRPDLRARKVQPVPQVPADLKGLLELREQQVLPVLRARRV
jgi:hypothetical protein